MNVRAALAVNRNAGRLMALYAAIEAAISAQAPAMLPTPEGEALPVDRLARQFGLDDAAVIALLLAAAADLAPDALAGIRPDVALARQLGGEGMWLALCPQAPLRRWRLIELEGGGALTTRLLRIDERVLSHIVGIDFCDARLDGFLTAIDVQQADTGCAAAADRIAAAWRADAEGRWPVLHVSGADPDTRRLLGATTAKRCGFRPFALDRAAIPQGGYERTALIRLCEREMMLANGALLIEGEEAEAATRAFVDTIDAPVILGGDPPEGLVRARLRADAGRDERNARLDQWRHALGAQAHLLPSGAIERVARQFELSARDIAAAALEATDPLAPVAQPLADRLWIAARGYARVRLSALAEPIDAAAGWDDIVLPPDRIAQLQAIAVHARRAAQVEEDWGWSARGRRGLGVTALFAGPSGTGKTMAAEVLARELRLDLYRIDLSQVISKYIGETEKNLRRIFAAAEASGAILLFDEADALFGKRSEVKDSHDRYANVEVSYLLQRMEAYRGLAILTTNLKGSLDGAFLRRLRFVIDFPFPDAAQRAAIWARIFPKETPVEGLDPARLARLSVAGGAIRTIAINAAFSAAEDGAPVTQRHVAAGARREYAKLEKPVTAAEFGSLE